MKVLLHISSVYDCLVSLPATGGPSPLERSENIFLPVPEEGESAAAGWSSTAQTSPEIQRCRGLGGHFHS